MVMPKPVTVIVRTRYMHAQLCTVQICMRHLKNQQSSLAPLTSQAKLCHKFDLPHRQSMFIDKFGRTWIIHNLNDFLIVSHILLQPCSPKAASAGRETCEPQPVAKVGGGDF